MKLNDLPQTSTWTLARRAERMNPSVIREILKVTEKPGIISFAGGLPSPSTFPIEAMAEATAAAYDCSCEFQFHRNYPPTVNHEAETDFVKQVLAGALDRIRQGRRWRHVGVGVEQMGDGLAGQHGIVCRYAGMFAPRRQLHAAGFDGR